MIRRKVVIRNSTGLHARPASKFVLEAKKYESDITARDLRHSGSPFNAKSIMSVLVANVPSRATIEICCDGPDEREAMAGMVDVVESGMGA